MVTYSEIKNLTLNWPIFRFKDFFEPWLGTLTPVLLPLLDRRPREKHTAPTGYVRVTVTGIETVTVPLANKDRFFVIIAG